MKNTVAVYLRLESKNLHRVHHYTSTDGACITGVWFQFRMMLLKQTTYLSLEPRYMNSDNSYIYMKLGMGCVILFVNVQFLEW